MSARPILRVLAPALVAATGGALAQLAWDTPYLTVLAAALGAAAVSIMQGTDEARPKAVPDTPKPPPSPMPVDRTGEISRELLEAMPFSAILISASGTIETLNAQAREMFSLQETSGLPVASLRTRRLLDLIESVQHTGRDGSVELSMTRRSDVHLVAHVRRIDPARLQAGQPPRLLVLIEDQTQARKTSALHRDFVANASHELKTPLAAISATVETLLGHARDDPEASERFLNILTSQSNRMTRLINDLLSLNRIELNERVTPEDPQDLYAIVCEVVDILRPVARAAEVSLQIRMPAVAPTVLADREELGQLFQNLIENAIKYGSSGTEVMVRPAAPSEAYPGMIGVAVVDTGPGIELEHIPRLTERFYRVSVANSRERGGTGLGLAIVKHIVNRHRGRLEIKSAPGKGSSFTVWLRASEAEESVETSDQIRTGHEHLAHDANEVAPIK
ncbi:MAG: ATP-binding protein [Pseudomonadota bacterium]